MTRRIQLSEIDSAIAAGSTRKFRAKYPGKCLCCGHSFRTPVEMVVQLGPGRIVCMDCYLTARTTDGQGGWK